MQANDFHDLRWLHAHPLDIQSHLMVQALILSLVRYLKVAILALARTPLYFIRGVLHIHGGGGLAAKALGDVVYHLQALQAFM